MNSHRKHLVASPGFPGELHEARRQDSRRSETVRGKPDAIHFDDSLPGFGLRLRASGDKVRRSWIVQYRRAGATRRMLLGSAEVLTADQARAAAKKTLAAIALGQDPQAEKAGRRSADKFTLATMIEDHLAAKQSSRARANIRGGPTLSARAVLQALAWHAGRQHHTPRCRSTTVSHNPREWCCCRFQRPGALSALFTWALANGLAEANPVIGTARPKTPPPRDRVLSDAELAAIWQAAGDDNFGRIVKLLMLLAPAQDRGRRHLLERTRP